MKDWHVFVIGICIMLASLLHGLLVTRHVPIPAGPVPSHTGYVQGELWKQEPGGIAHVKCNGFKVECYDSFVLVYVDKTKEPTWTDNYVLTIPWSKIEHLTLMPE